MIIMISIDMQRKHHSGSDSGPKAGFHLSDFFIEFASEFAERVSIQGDAVFRREVEILSTFTFC